MVRKEDIEEAESNKDKLKEEMGKYGTPMNFNRSCTDIICCLIFIAFIVCMVGVSGYAITTGDPVRILTPFDSDGNACGNKDQCSSDDYAWPQGMPCPTVPEGQTHVAYKVPANATQSANKEVMVPKARDFTGYDFKYFPLTSANFFTAVCVKACPGNSYSAKEEKGGCVVASNGQAGTVTPDTPTVTSGVTYDYTTLANYKNLDSCRNACFMDKSCKGYQFVGNTCTNWQTEPKGNGLTGENCYIKDTNTMTEVQYLKNDDEDGMVPAMPGQAQGKLFALFPTGKQMQICLPTKEVGVDLMNKMLKQFDESSGMVKYLVELGECWQVIAGMAGATIFISLFYILLLRWITKPLLYTSMLIILIGFILLGGWCWLKKDEYDPVVQENEYTAAFAGAITAWVVAFIYFCFILCCWSNIALGASIMKAASRFVTDNCMVMLLPIGSYIICVPYICYWIVTAVFLYSIGEPYFQPTSFVAEIRWTDQTNYLWWFFLFGLLWSVAFIICVQQFMIAATVCQWYFTRGSDADGKQKGTASVWLSFKWGIWYHCGSIAFGSFIIALITFIRIIFEYIVYQYEKVGNKENPVYKCLKCYIRYVLWCLDKYVKFITKNAFIQIALQSTNFCSAAWSSFFLVIRHCGKFSATAMVGWIMMILGKGTIMGVSCYLTFLLVKETKPDVKQPILPAVIVLLIAYMVGSMFLSIFSFASTAILHCFILSDDVGNGVDCPEDLKPFLTANEDHNRKQEAKNGGGGNPAASGTGKKDEDANNMN